ncbi:hypothetical protein BP5796_02862 [Coleophoma crateriformis]|uniref:Uncharacterized protein n=1 Tax=Coleophoma crateriformis TaxID=565419 RepID=A0A3D8SZE5_9HELO|nr:hypothetical protein BP5796_02862 [Coleophoma crateriformis]
MPSYESNDFNSNGPSAFISVSQGFSVCADQPYTIQGFFRTAQLSNIGSCGVMLCALWTSNQGDSPGGYCSSYTQLSDSYAGISGTYPPNPNADAKTGGSMFVSVSCEITDSSLPAYGSVLLDDITLINQDFPVAAPVPNPSPTTACAPISISTSLPTCTAAPGSSSGGGGGSVSTNQLQSATRHAYTVLGDIAIMSSTLSFLVPLYQQRISDAQNAISNTQSGTTGGDATIRELNMIIYFSQDSLAKLTPAYTTAQQAVADMQTLLDDISAFQ